MDRYQAILDYLYNRLPMFQRTGPAAYKHSLGNTLLLDDLYGHPHRNYPTLHVAGTNGKGSVSHMLAAVLQSAAGGIGLACARLFVEQGADDDEDGDFGRDPRPNARGWVYRERRSICCPIHGNRANPVMSNVPNHGWPAAVMKVGKWCWAIRQYNVH